MVELNRNFRLAVKDLVWLLDRAYPRKPSIELVGNRYMLSRDERLILMRGVFNRELCRIRRNKLSKEVKEDTNIIIDGLNVLISIHSYLMGRTVFRSLDGYVRDISGVFGNFTFKEKAIKAFELIVTLFTKILFIQEKDINLFIFLDYKVSKSGDFAWYIRNSFNNNGIKAEVVVDKKSDSLIIEKANLMENSLVASSDTAIIDRVKSMIDIPSLTINEMLNKEIMDLKRISGIRSVG